MIQLHFWRKHLPSETIYIGTFDATHVAALAHMPFHAAERECRVAVNRWNAMPSNTDWVYEYIGIRNAEVQQWEQERA